jgi:hypothetical protein
MDERPRPDIEHTREALRKHDERIAESEEDDADDESAPEEDEGDEE